MRSPLSAKRSIDPTPLEPIQMLWIRGDLSRMELLSIRSFLAQGHPVHLYTYEPANNLPGGVEVRDAAEIVPPDLAPLSNSAPFAKGSFGAFSDYFRYHLLHRCGGWWSDLDIVCIRPWRFQNALTASTQEHSYGRIANTCVMRFPAGHPLMERCLAALSPVQLKEVNISQTGPLLLNRNMRELGLSHLPVESHVFCPIPWNASWQLLRPLWRRFSLDEVKQRIRRPHLSMRFTQDTVAVHLWNETWRAAGHDKNARHPRSCLYEKLQHKWNP